MDKVNVGFMSYYLSWSQSEFVRDHRVAGPRRTKVLAEDFYLFYRDWLVLENVDDITFCLSRFESVNSKTSFTKIIHFLCFPTSVLAKR